AQQRLQTEPRRLGISGVANAPAPPALFRLRRPVLVSKKGRFSNREDIGKTTLFTPPPRVSLGGVARSPQRGELSGEQVRRHGQHSLELVPRLFDAIATVHHFIP